MIQHLRQACLYLPDSDAPAIVAAMHVNPSGIYFEQDDDVLIEDWQKPERLVPNLRFALERFSPKNRNLRETKRTDWPSYRLSGVRSLARFERSYFPIGVAPASPAELSYDAWAVPRDDPELTVHVTLNRHGTDVELARRLLKLYHVCVTSSLRAA